MNRLWAMLAIGFLGMSLTTGCGGGGDMMAPEDLGGAPTPEQLEAEKRYAEESAAEEKMNTQK